MSIEFQQFSGGDTPGPPYGIGPKAKGAQKSHLARGAILPRYGSARRIPHLRDLSYGERLAIINLETLELRRLKADLTMYYKILHGLTPMSVDDYFVITSHTRSTRASDKFLLSKAGFVVKRLRMIFLSKYYLLE